MELKDIDIITPDTASARGKKLDTKVALIPILRSGLGMTDAMLELLPFAETYHLGMYRQRESLVPVIYYDNLPRENPCDIAIVLEPMVATASSIVAAISLIKEAYQPKQIILISLVISSAGMRVLQEEHPDITVHAAAVDDVLQQDGTMTPGVGDVGDRLFGTGSAVTTGPPANPEYYDGKRSAGSRKSSPTNAGAKKKRKVGE